MIVTVERWGSNLGVRIPRSVARAACLAVGTEVNVTVAAGKIVLRPVDVPSLRDLLAQIKPGSQPALADWGERVGSESW